MSVACQWLLPEPGVTLFPQSDGWFAVSGLANANQLKWRSRIFAAPCGTTAIRMRLPTLPITLSLQSDGRIVAWWGAGCRSSSLVLDGVVASVGGRGGRSIRVLLLLPRYWMVACRPCLGGRWEFSPSREIASVVGVGPSPRASPVVVRCPPNRTVMGGPWHLSSSCRAGLAKFRGA